MEMANFENLSDKDRQKVANLIDKLANKANRSTQETTSDIVTGGKERNVRRPPASQVKQVSQQGTHNQKRSRVDQHQKAQSPPVRKSQIVYGTVDPSLAIDTPNRPNFFINNGFAELHQEDIKIDQKLKGNNAPVDRGVRNELIDVRCNHCGRDYTVSVKLVQRDVDGIRFMCDKCQRGRQ